MDKPMPASFFLLAVLRATSFRGCGLRLFVLSHVAEA
jgi:hypothetical protein